MKPDIIFLDFDGVLNSESSFIYNRMVNNDPKQYVANPNPISVTFIDYLLFITNAKIVISSSWRNGRLDSIKETLAEEFGLKRVNRVIDQTPRFWGSDIPRGKEIQHWLDNHDWNNYVIIDDDSDMLDSQKDHFVNTDFRHGFTIADMMKAFKILGKDETETRVYHNEERILDFQNGIDYYKDRELKGD